MQFIGNPHANWDHSEFQGCGIYGCNIKKPLIPSYDPPGATNPDHSLASCRSIQRFMGLGWHQQNRSACCFIAVIYILLSHVREKGQLIPFIKKHGEANDCMSNTKIPRASEWNHIALQLGNISEEFTIWEYMWWQPNEWVYMYVNNSMYFFCEVS